MHIRMEGGAYIVAHDNLGKLYALVAASALLTDYILTVSVSISSGVAQIISAYPNLHQYRVPIAVVAVFLIMLINLRGVRQIGGCYRGTELLLHHHVICPWSETGMFRSLFGSLGTVI